MCIDMRMCIDRCTLTLIAHLEPYGAVNLHIRRASPTAFTQHTGCEEHAWNAWHTMRLPTSLTPSIWSATFSSSRVSVPLSSLSASANMCSAVGPLYSAFGATGLGRGEGAAGVAGAAGFAGAFLAGVAGATNDPPAGAAVVASAALLAPHPMLGRWKMDLQNLALARELAEKIRDGMYGSPYPGKTLGRKAGERPSLASLLSFLPMWLASRIESCARVVRTACVSADLVCSCVVSAVGCLGILDACREVQLRAMTVLSTRL